MRECEDSLHRIFIIYLEKKRRISNEIEEKFNRRPEIEIFYRIRSISFLGDNPMQNKTFEKR